MLAFLVYETGSKGSEHRHTDVVVRLSLEISSKLCSHSTHKALPVGRSQCGRAFPFCVSRVGICECCSLTLCETDEGPKMDCF